MAKAKKDEPDKSEAQPAPPDPVKLEVLERRGQHGLQREPQDETSLTRLCELLELSTEVSVTTVLREAADTIEELRKE